MALRYFHLNCFFEELRVVVNFSFLLRSFPHLIKNEPIIKNYCIMELFSLAESSSALPRQTVEIFGSS